MGGHGGLNILPQKRWHVYRDDNRLRVLRDEREFQQAVQAERQQQQRVLLTDAVIRFKRRKREVTGEPAVPEYIATSAAHSSAGEGRKSNMICRAQNEFGSFAPEGATSVAQGRLGITTASATESQVLSQFTGKGQPPTNLHFKVQHQSAAVSHGVSANGANNDGPTVGPFKSKQGCPDPTGKQSNGHVNFFEVAECEATKKHKERERYLLQAGHSASRQSEFSVIANELKNVWYASEMPFNRRAREEREGCWPRAQKSDPVVAAAAEAKRRMLALRQQRQDGVGSETPWASTANAGNSKAKSLSLVSASSDSDICIVEESSSRKDVNKKGGITKGVSSKKGSSRADSKRDSHKERKLLKRMKRKWMLDALELHSKAEGSFQLDRTEGYDRNQR